MTQQQPTHSPRPDLETPRGGFPLGLILALFLLPALAAGLWFAFGRAGDVEQTLVAEDEQPAIETDFEELAPALEAPPESEAPEREQVTEGSEPTEETPTLAQHLDTDIPRLRLTGSVQLPPGTPRDETPLVIAISEARKHQLLASTPSQIDAALREDGQHPQLLAVAPVDAEGHYAIDVPAERDEVHLALIGHYLAPLQTTRVVVAEDTVVPLLEAELGAWITGRVRFPEGTTFDVEDLDGLEIELGPDLGGSFDAMSIQNTAVTRDALLDEDGRFEFHALTEPGNHGVAWKHDELAGGVQLGIATDPGRHIELDLEFTVGGSISGRVLDEQGRPIEDVELGLRYRGAIGQSVGRVRKTHTAADGSFLLEHLPTGDFVLRAEHDVFRTKNIDVPETLEANGKLEGVLIELIAGARFLGTVRFPDGDLAAGVWVKASVDFRGQLGGMNSGVDFTDGGNDTTDEAGTFEIEGLGDSKFNLEAEWSTDDGKHAGEWGLRRDGILASGESLELVLEKLAAIEGEVVDVRGEPIASFEVRGTLDGTGAMFGIGAETQEKSVSDSTDGRFRLGALRAGVWKLRVHADGFARSDEQEIVLPLPDGGAPFRFVLPDAAAVSGVVLDSAGMPVSGARVSLQLDMAARVQAGIEGTDRATFSDGEGVFLLESLDPGALALIATREGFAASEAVPAELLGGETITDITLTLRTGGTLTGVVLTPEGEPRPGRSVILQKMPTVDRQHILESGPDGSFAKEHLEPGTWQIVVMANVMNQSAADASEEGVARTLGDMLIERVEIVEGETVHLVLGASEGRPIEVSGRVTHAGEGVASSIVSFVPEDSSGIGDLKMTVTDKQGNYSTTLDRRGAWLVTVQNNVATGRQNSVEYLERIPADADKHTFDIELPGGRITGRVVGPKGKPVSNCRITLNVEGGIAYGSFLGGQYNESVTDSDGRYDIPYLREGRYAIAAGGPTLGGMFGDDSSNGRTVRGGLEVGDGQWLEGVDFRLEHPGDLKGVVLGLGNLPLEGAAIFLRDETGLMVERFSFVTTDANGAFTYRGLAPGRYTAFARSGSLVSESSAEVEVRSGSASSVELHLTEGCVIVVRVQDKSGKDLRTRVSIVDSEGREQTGALSMSEIMEQFGEGFSSKEQRVGPLPLGRYHVRAVTDDGREVERKVSLLRAGERKVRLQLK